MGHALTAIVTSESNAKAIAALSPHAERIKLLQGFAMVPASETFIDYIEHKRSVPGDDPFPIFTYLSRSLHRALLDCSYDAPVAYLETDYFGGIGSQMALGYHQGQVAIEPLRSEAKYVGHDVILVPKGVEPINQVLRFLGVSADNCFDEFDALELGRYRETPTMD